MPHVENFKVQSSIVLERSRFQSFPEGKAYNVLSMTFYPMILFVEPCQIVSERHVRLLLQSEEMHLDSVNSMSSDEVVFKHSLELIKGVDGGD